PYTAMQPPTPSSSATAAHSSSSTTASCHTLVTTTTNRTSSVPMCTTSAASMPPLPYQASASTSPFSKISPPDKPADTGGEARERRHGPLRHVAPRCQPTASHAHQQPVWPRVQ
ncbi:unnamed protein product, partial [Closterium sp. NIES-53]